MTEGQKETIEEWFYSRDRKCRYCFAPIEKNNNHLLMSIHTPKNGGLSIIVIKQVCGTCGKKVNELLQSMSK